MNTKIWLLSFSVFAFSTLASAQADRTGNGGAGVIRNGEYHTFYSGGHYKEPLNSSGPSDDSATVQTINKLASYIANAPFLSSATKSKYLQAIVPTPTRRYLKSVPDSLTLQVRQRLIAQFARVTGVDPKTLVLYAVTDTNSKRTFLLPTFSNLTETRQMAILFHESHWIVKPDTTYQDVVNAEMAFQAVLEAPTGPRIYHLMKYIGNGHELEHAAVKSDLSTRALQGFLSSSNSFNTKQLAGSAALKCADQNNDHATSFLYPCGGLVIQNMSELLLQYPNSIVLKEIAERLSKDLTCYMNNGKAPFPCNLVIPYHYFRAYGMVESKWITLTLNPRASLSSKAIEGEYVYRGQFYIPQRNY